MCFYHPFNPKLTVPITQQYQNPDGNYLPEVNVVLQDTGNILVSDPTSEVFVVVVTLSTPSDTVLYRGLRVDVMPNLRT